MKYFTLFALAIFSFTSVFAQTDKEKVISTVEKTNIEGHIYFLADDMLKGRETGTPENKIAALYLANTLRSYGVKPNPKTGDYFQKIQFKKTLPSERIFLSINGKEYKKVVALEAARMEVGGTGEYLGYGLADDYKKKDVRGKLVVIKAGSPDAKDARAAFGLREQKKDLAMSAGAIGLIELVEAQDNIWGFIEHNFNSPRLELDDSDISENTENKEMSKSKKGEVSKNGFSYVWVQDAEGGYAADLAAQETLKIKHAMTGSTIEKVLSQNVIGVVEGTDPKLKNEYIIYSAHYDHVGIGTPDASGDNIYNGARDNAVGTTTVLSMAENLTKYPTKRSALFILFTGEEKGLLGSEYYVENPVLPLNQMVYCFNSDNAGYNDTSLATIIGLPRTTAEQTIKNAATAFGITAIDDPAPEQGLFDRSDNVHFAAKGIPAPTFSLGFTAFNGDVTKYYHRPGDEADNLDYDYLLKFFRAYVLAGRSIANDPVTPFWVAGDKYEAAGKKLYNR